MLELAYRTRDKRPECSIFWISATNAENVQQAYFEIAQQLNIPGLEDKKGDISELVQRYLSQESAGQWLLVVDNADDLDMWLRKTDGNPTSTRLIDSLPRSEKGSIVFTTRSRKAASKFAHSNIIHVAEMNEDAATLVLRNSLVNKEVLDDSAMVTQLLKLLTFLPLAIVQAAAYINENDMSLEEYISLFDDHEESVIEILSEDFEDEGRYHDLLNPIATTWLISFEQIRVRDPLAADYLSSMACLDPKAIPPFLLPAAPSKKKALDAIGTLSAYSFITRRPGGELLDMHRLVHLATRNWIRNQNLLDEWTLKTLARLADVFPDNDPERRSQWRSYFPHAQYVQTSDVFKQNFRDNIPWVRNFGRCLLADGRFSEAEAVFTQIIETCKEELGEWHPDSRAVISDLASTYWNQGRWDEAEKLEVQLMELTREALGEKHTNTLTSMSNLALTYRDQRRLDEAEELLVRVFEVTKEEHGERHPDTLISMSNLALTYRDQGRLDEAEQLQVQGMRLSKEVHGEKHPNTLTSMNNLALTYWDQGRLDEAEQLQAQTLQTRSEVLGEKHPSTLICMDGLASTYRSQGRVDEAQRLHLQVVKMRKEVLCERHPSTLASTVRLAFTYMDQGRWGEAKQLQVQVMDMRNEVLGETHPETLDGMYNLTFTLKQLGPSPEALSLLEKCFQQQKRALGPDHPDTKASLETLNDWRGAITEI